jgi:hypothetical protein
MPFLLCLEIESDRARVSSEPEAIAIELAVAVPFRPNARCFYSQKSFGHALTTAVRRESGILSLFITFMRA